MATTAVRGQSATFFPALGGDLPTIVRAEGVYLRSPCHRRIIRPMPRMPNSRAVLTEIGLAYFVPGG